MTWHRNIARNIARNICRRQEDDVCVSGSVRSEAANSVESIDCPLYYSDTRNIEDWNHENIRDWNNEKMCEVLEVIEAEEDARDERIRFGHEALRESEAYKWLTSAVQRNIHMNDIQPSCMESHRQWLLRLINQIVPQEHVLKHQKISRHRRPTLYTAIFELSWNLIDFLQGQEYTDKNLSACIGRVITLSGDHHYVQALPCKEYMNQIWPSTGAHLVQLFERLIETPTLPHECGLTLS